jgi:hypothetical protein
MADVNVYLLADVNVSLLADAHVSQLTDVNVSLLADVNVSLQWLMPMPLCSLLQLRFQTGQPLHPSATGRRLTVTVRSDTVALRKGPMLLRANNFKNCAPSFLKEMARTRRFRLQRQQWVTNCRI